MRKTCPRREEGQYQWVKTHVRHLVCCQEERLCPWRGGITQYPAARELIAILRLFSDAVNMCDANDAKAIPVKGCHDKPGGLSRRGKIGPGQQPLEDWAWTTMAAYGRTWDGSHGRTAVDARMAPWSGPEMAAGQSIHGGSADGYRSAMERSPARPQAPLGRPLARV